MRKIHFYFDESGEKGFIGSHFTAEDIGVVAGIALPADDVAGFEADVSRILAKADQSQVKKLHATELFKDGANASVKGELIRFLAARKGWLLVYEAVYPLGIYRQQVLTESHLGRQGPKAPRVKISKNKASTRIYTELLIGVMIKLDQICRQEGVHSVAMFSDQIDKGLLNEANTTLGYLKQEMSTRKVSGFDTITKKVVHGSVTSQVIGFDNAVRFVKEITAEDKSSMMTVVADTICNGLYRHLKRAAKENPGVRLHGHAALSGYELEERVAFAGDDYVMDTHYAPND